MARRGRGRGQGNRGRKSGRAGAGTGGSKGKGKGKGKGSSNGRRGGQGNRSKGFGRANSQSKNKSTGGDSTGRRGGQGNRGRKPGTAKGTVSLGTIGKGLSKIGGAFGRRMLGPGAGLLGKALSHPAIGRAIAQGFVNSPHASDYNKLQRDKTKLTEQQLRQVERWEQKTGRDWEKRKEVGRINLSMDQIARFAKLDQNDWKSKLYKSLPQSIRDARVNKTFYGNEKKKGWHSSMRPGRGHGVKDGFDFGPEFLIDQKTPEARNNFLKIIRGQGTPYARDNFLKQIRTQPKQPPVMAKPLPLPMPRDLSGDDNPKNIPNIPIALPPQQAAPPSSSLNNFLKIIRR